MNVFRRLPAGVRASLTTEPGERVLTFTPSADGHLVATTLALFLPDGTRIPYETIEKASWDESGLRLVIMQAHAGTVIGGSMVRSGPLTPSARSLLRFGSSGAK